MRFVYEIFENLIKIIDKNVDDEKLVKSLKLVYDLKKD